MFVSATKITAVALSLVLVAATLGMTSAGIYIDCENAVDAPVGTDYPYVFVHGMAGWGDTSGLNKIAHYWGVTCGSLTEHLRELGYDCYEASVGPLSSTWDRTCELYAELTGTTVDYGVAHSLKYSHDRFGRTYDSPLVEGWGELDENGKRQKINLYGHSFGGATIRLLAHLLVEGCPEEVEAAGGGDVSPLFTGGKNDYIYSITTIASPHNGCTLNEALGGATPFIKTLYFISEAAVGNIFPELLDIQLEQYGVIDIPGTRRKLDREAVEKIGGNLEHFYDSGDTTFEDVTLAGAAALNEKITTCENVYYFSYAVCGTRESALSGNHVPDYDTFLALWPSSYLIGKFHGTLSDGTVADERWLANDGVCNTISCVAPFNAPSVDFNADSIEPGVWNKMPIIRGDHASAIGLLRSFDSIAPQFEDHMAMINSLAED